MPYINIKITREGATHAQKAELIAGVTDLMVRVLDKSPATTFVVIRNAQVAQQLRHAMDVDTQPDNAWHTTADFNPDGAVSAGKRLKVWLRRVVPKAVL